MDKLKELIEQKIAVDDAHKKASKAKSKLQEDIALFKESLSLVDVIELIGGVNSPIIESKQKGSQVYCGRCGSQIGELVQQVRNSYGYSDSLQLRKTVLINGHDKNSIITNNDLIVSCGSCKRNMYFLSMFYSIDMYKKNIDQLISSLHTVSTEWECLVPSHTIING